LKKTSKCYSIAALTSELRGGLFYAEGDSCRYSRSIQRERNQRGGLFAISTWQRGACW